MPLHRVFSQVCEIFPNHSDNISMRKPEHGTSRKYTLNRLREQRLISWATLAKLVISLWYEI